MADALNPQGPMAGDGSFESALQQLVSALVEGGASPKEAVQVAQQVAKPSPTPKRSWMPEVGAGGNGLPYMPPLAQNRLAGEMRSANEFPLSDFVAERSGSPLAGRVVDKVAKVGRATGDMAAGMSPVAPWAMQVGEDLGKSAAQTDFGAMLGPSTAQAQGLSTLDRLLAQQAELTKQRAAAQAERDAQAKGDPARGIKAGRGPNYDRSGAELDRLDQQLSSLAEQVKTEQYNQSEEGQLKAAREKAAFQEGERAKEYGKPIREYLPPAVAHSLPVMATALGALATRGIAGRSNREYGRALDAYRGAESQSNISEMALRRAQLAELEKPNIGRAGATVAAAGLPAEVRLAETVIDASRDPNSRASKEAWARIHDPSAMTFDVGTSLLSSGVGYGLGTKYAPNQPDRSLGKAIVNTPYHRNALGIADDYAEALAAGEKLGSLRTTGSPSPAPGGGAPPAPNQLAGPTAPPRQLPAPGASPNQSTSPEPVVVTKSRGKDGVTRYHEGDTGHFRGNPRNRND